MQLSLMKLIAHNLLIKKVEKEFSSFYLRSRLNIHNDEVNIIFHNKKHFQNTMLKYIKSKS